MNYFQACCGNQESDRYPINLDALTMVSLLLVELVSPDVMYNGLPWPDEEFTKAFRLNITLSTCYLIVFILLLYHEAIILKLIII